MHGFPLNVSIRMIDLKYVPMTHANAHMTCANGYMAPSWRHQMETFSALLAICAGNSPVPGEFPAQRQVTRSFGICFDLRLIKRLRKQSWGWWFETLSCPLWHCNDIAKCTGMGFQCAHINETGECDGWLRERMPIINKSMNGDKLLFEFGILKNTFSFMIQE